MLSKEDKEFVKELQNYIKPFEPSFGLTIATRDIEQLIYIIRKQDELIELMEDMIDSKLSTNEYFIGVG